MRNPVWERIMTQNCRRHYCIFYTEQEIKIFISDLVMRLSVVLPQLLPFKNNLQKMARHLKVMGHFRKNN